MAAHSTILAWRVLWTEEPGGLWSTGSQKESDLAVATEHAAQHNIAEAFSLAQSQLCKNKYISPTYIPTGMDR